MGYLGECVKLGKRPIWDTFPPSIRKKPQTSGKHLVICDCSLDMQNIPEKLAQQQIWGSGNAPTLINEVRRKMEMLVL